MKEQNINWDSIPEILSKEDLCRICHIAKKTALHLLRSGRVPCEFSGKKTRCYRIRKSDVQNYLNRRELYPELYSAPNGWYGMHSHPLQIEISGEVLKEMHIFLPPCSRIIMM